MVALCSAGKKLDRWLTKNEHSRSWLCRELGVASSVLWRWMTGKQLPRVDFASRIEAITGGDVSTNQWRTAKPAEKAA